MQQSGIHFVVPLLSNFVTMFHKSVCLRDHHANPLGPDNFQGEESDIVLVSLTRSNKAHDIGFMAMPERLNVLLSRARDALILVGNSETFLNARKGRELWRKFFDMLKENDHVYEGFPVKCGKHPDRTALLSSANDFDVQCPDGGCREPW